LYGDGVGAGTGAMLPQSMLASRLASVSAGGCVEGGVFVEWSNRVVLDEMEVRRTEHCIIY
jgi:hypothetical protein